MKHESRLHYNAAKQTTPDIFAASGRFAADHFQDNCCYFEWTMCITLKGRCRWQSANNEEFDVTPGHVVVTRPHAWHTWKSVRSKTNVLDGSDSGDNFWEVAWVVFQPRPHWTRWLDALPYKDGIARLYFDGKAFADLERAMLNTAKVYSKGSLLRDDRALAAVEMVLITVAEQTEGIRIVPDPRMRDAADAIHDRFAESLNVSELASAANLSKPHFSALFTASIGMSPGQYVEHVRLACAAEKLRFGNESIGDIARAVGYAEPKYFAHRFHLRFGHTPREFRRITRTGSRHTTD